jgi:serine/threonine-protein kinase RsbT
VAVLHTDGVSGRFPFARLRGLDAAALARSIVTSYGKPSDDAACAVAIGLANAQVAAGVGDARALSFDIRVPGDAEFVAVSTRTFAERAGFGTKAQWQLGIAVSELATNVLKFGKEGRLSLTLAGSPREHIVVEVTDRGAGIADVRLASTDGFSEGAPLGGDRPRGPGQGLGVGLGTVRRMMDDVEIETGPSGTRIVARKFRASE